MIASLLFLPVLVIVLWSIDATLARRATHACEVKPLTDRQRADFDYYRDHCRGCDAEFDTKWRICPNECQTLNP